jgi:putative membrane protein
MNLIIRWLVTSIALLVAAWLVPGIHVPQDSFLAFGAMALILGLVNAFVRPLLKLLSCPLIVVTLGLFVLVINGLTLMLASWIARHWFGVGFYVDGFWSAFFGALIVSIVSVILNTVLGDDKSSAS